jgi:hypothetical protein
MDGRRLIDVHLNGGPTSRRRNPELIEVIQRGMRGFDMGNHHFPSELRLQCTICGFGGHQDRSAFRPAARSHPADEPSLDCRIER